MAPASATPTQPGTSGWSEALNEAHRTKHKGSVRNYGWFFNGLLGRFMRNKSTGADSEHHLPISCVCTNVRPSLSVPHAPPTISALSNICLIPAFGRQQPFSRAGQDKIPSCLGWVLKLVNLKQLPEVQRNCYPVLWVRPL